jgi:hypothetical protein
VRVLSGSIQLKSRQSAGLLIAILLTGFALIGHRFLPDRRLALEPLPDNSNFFLMQSGNGAPADIQWIDQSHYHFACQFPKAAVDQGCSFGYQLHSGNVNEGTDLSRYQTMNLSVSYTGNPR